MTGRCGAAGGRVLAVFAHPDDETLLAGGTLAACAAGGSPVAILSLTHGEAGPIAAPGLATRVSLGQVRAAELRTAAAALGAREALCLAYPDGELADLDEGPVVADLARRIRAWQPAAVLTFGPEGLYWHPDHCAVQRLVTAALDQAAGAGPLPWLYYATWPAGLAADLVAAMAGRGLATDLWGLHPSDFGAPPESITTTVDVRPWLAAKLRALRSHRSQIAAGHLLAGLPDDLAAAFLGREYFACVRPAGQQGGDWLAATVAGATAGG